VTVISPRSQTRESGDLTSRPISGLDKAGGGGGGPEHGPLAPYLATPLVMANIVTCRPLQFDTRVRVLVVVTVA